MRFSFFFIFLFATLYVTHAQEGKRIDSLLKRLSVAKADTGKVLLLLALAKEHQITDLGKARAYTDKAMELSNRLKYMRGVMASYRYYAYIYAYQSQFDSIVYVNRRVLELARQANDSFNIGAAYFNIGSAKRFNHDIDSALQYMLEGAKLLEGKGYTNIESALYDGLQSLYMTMAQYDKAIAYGEKAVHLARVSKSMEDLATALNNLGLSLIEVSRVNDAKAVYAEGLKVAREIGYKHVEAMLLNNLSAIYLREGKFAEAYSNAQKVLDIQQQAPDSNTMTQAYLTIASYHLAKADYTQAQANASRALVIADQLDVQDIRANAFNLLAAIAFAQNKPAEGMKYQLAARKVDEKVFNESVRQREANWRVRYETEKKDNQIQLQLVSIKSKTTWNYVLIGSAIGLLLMSLLSYRNYRHRQRLQLQRINELETEKQLAATEAVLKGEEQERTRLAKDLHDGLGGMLSGIKYSMNTMKGNLVMTPENALAFERSMDMLDSSIREMRRVAHNMMPEALVKFGLDTALRDFCNDVNQSGALKVTYQSIGLEGAELEQTKAITIYRIVQELLNNTMKHAAATSAIVQVSHNDNQLSVTVEDDGKGFDPSVLRGTKGIGWSNIQNRVDFLKGRWDVDSQPGKGTSVHIEINA